MYDTADKPTAALALIKLRRENAVISVPSLFSVVKLTASFDCYRRFEILMTLLLRDHPGKSTDDPYNTWPYDDKPNDGGLR